MSFAEQFSQYARQHGVNALRFHIEQAERRAVDIFKGEADSFSASKVNQVYIEADVNGALGSAFTEDVSEAAFPGLVEMLKASAAHSEAVFRPLPPIAPGKTRVADNTDIAGVAPRLLALERQMLALDSRVSTASVRGGFVSRKVTLAGSDGAQASDSYGAVMMGFRVVAKDGGQTQTCNEHIVCPAFVDPTPYGLEAARRAVSLLGAQPCDGGQYPVVFEGPVFSRILEAYIPCFYATRVQRGTSLMAGKLGEAVAAQGLILREDPAGLVLRSFDDEGAPAAAKNIIDDGVLKRYLHRGGEQGGNGYRPSYRAAVQDGYTNIQLVPGGQSQPALEALCAKVENGLLIHECDGIFAGANPISGAFSLISKGWMIKDGKIDRPVSQITVGGNFFDLLQNITGWANDARPVGSPTEGTVSAPSVLVRSLAVSGK